MSLVRPYGMSDEDWDRFCGIDPDLRRTAYGARDDSPSSKITPEEIERRKGQIRASREMRHRKEALNGLRKELGSLSAEMPKALPAPVPDPWYIRAIRSVRQWITDTERRTRPTVT